MSIDLGAILDQVQPVIVSIIESSGTTVDLLKNPQGAMDETVNPATLASTDPTPDEPLAAGIPALVIPAASIAQQADGPHLISQAEPYTVLLLPDQTPPPVHGLVVVATCRDTKLIELRLEVLSVTGSSAGAVRRLGCGPVR